MNAQQPTSISTWLGQIKLKKIMSLQEPRAKNSVVLGVIFTREVLVSFSYHNNLLLKSRHTFNCMMYIIT